MARTVATRGRCYICKGEFGKAAMKSHILKCNKIKDGNANYFLIKVEGYYCKDYWLYIQVKETATLADLDDFLRDIWLECCGHLSSFTINGTIYDNEGGDDFFGTPLGSMGKSKLKNVLTKGMDFKHEYDFGSTTTLKLTVTESYFGTNTKDMITLLARNLMDGFICEKCGENAEYIISDYEAREYKPFCQECLDEILEEDEEFEVITITNSPRMGVCGYEGERDVY